MKSKQRLIICLNLLIVLFFQNACVFQTTKTDDGTITVTVLGNDNVIVQGNNVIVKKVQGNGVIVEKEFEIKDYHKINIEGAFDINYSITDSPFFEISTDENILEYIDVYVKNNTLHIKVKKEQSGTCYNLSPTKLNINSSSSTLSAISIAGSGDVDIQSDLFTESFSIKVSGSGDVKNKGVIKTTDLKIDIAGSGDISLCGEAKNATMSIAGSGDINLRSFSIENVDCSVSGSGDMKLAVKEKLIYAIAGSGDITYTGEPRILEGSVSGSGTIKKINE